MHHTGQAKSSTRQSESLVGGAERAQSFGRLKDFPLAQPDGAECDPREERPGHEHKVDLVDRPLTSQTEEVVMSVGQWLATPP
jgi:hypothetical protein